MMFDNITFYKSVFSLKEIPGKSLPQLILCGRSNVGKSSFINSLFTRKNLAKTSSTPGKTRSINFYNVDDLFFIVDLPGFGYAKISIEEREKWGKLASKYISTSDQIKHAFHIVDIRHDPTSLDLTLNEWLNHAGIQFTVILNKADKLKQSELNKAINSVQKFFPGNIPGSSLFIYSAVKGTGKKEVRKKIAGLFY